MLCSFRNRHDRLYTAMEWSAPGYFFGRRPKECPPWPRIFRTHHGRIRRRCVYVVFCVQPLSQVIDPLPRKTRLLRLHVLSGIRRGHVCYGVQEGPPRPYVGLQVQEQHLTPRRKSRGARFTDGALRRNPPPRSLSHDRS